jgi:hypothetical protein
MDFIVTMILDLDQPIMSDQVRLESQLPFLDEPDPGPDPEAASHVGQC